MQVLRFKVKKVIELESLSDALAGYSASVQLTETAEIEMNFEYEIEESLASDITEIMTRMGAERC